MTTIPTLLKDGFPRNQIGGDRNRINMARIEIISWREDAVGFTGWDGHISSELKRRLRRALNAAPAVLRNYVNKIKARELVTIENVKEEAVPSLQQILETQGADLAVHPDL